MQSSLAEKMYTWLESGGGLPAHFHPLQEERWSVLEGRVRLRLGDEKRVIGAEDGEMVVAPGQPRGSETPATPHGYEQNSSATDR